MRITAISILLLAVVLVSSSVSASPIPPVYRTNSIWEFIYSMSIKLIDRHQAIEWNSERDLLGGDADDYANGRDRGNDEDEVSKLGSATDSRYSTRATVIYKK